VQYGFAEELVKIHLRSDPRRRTATNWNFKLISQSTQQPFTAPKYIRGLVLEWTGEIDSNVSQTYL